MLRASLTALGLVALGAPVAAQDAPSAPTIDTEDASLGSADVGPGWLHPMVTLDLRNGALARGGYDDDAANLDRLPVHAAIAAAIDLHTGASGKADAWLVLNSSNGLHAPISSEIMRPRAWYESNNLVGLVIEPLEGFRGGLAYAIKTSPNLGSTATTHEASVTLSYEAETGLGALKPGFAATIKPKEEGRGAFTQVSIEPEFNLAQGDVAYGVASVAFTKPFALGVFKAQFRAEALARDRTLRRLGADDAETSAIVPQVTVALRVVY